MFVFTVFVFATEAQKTRNLQLVGRPERSRRIFEVDLMCQNKDSATGLSVSLRPCPFVFTVFVFATEAQKTRNLQSVGHPEPSRRIFEVDLMCQNKDSAAGLSITMSVRFYRVRFLATEAQKIRNLQSVGHPKPSRRIF